ncbi:MAG: STAS domain-containing protein [Pseudomonadota bacterium]
MDSDKNENVKNREKVMIRADKILDCSAHSIFTQACRQADHPDVQAIVVDLTATQGIRASGVGILLMLNDFGKKLSIPIRIENCNPQIKTQLASSRLLADLLVS